MTETTCCPYCGCPRESPLDSLYREVARIREIAERSGAGDGPRPVRRAVDTGEPAEQGARIAELTREVHELRATVARLRGSAVPGLARSG
jgi:hypothetical protein